MTRRNKSEKVSKRAWNKDFPLTEIREIDPKSRGFI